MEAIQNIYIIDDDPIFIYGTKRLIKEVNYEGGITVFQNGKEGLMGLAKIQDKEKSQPLIIFLDLNMPVMNGWEFLDAVHKHSDYNSLDLQIFVLSSSIDPKDTEKAYSYKMVKEFVSKPISPTLLEEILHS
ncbi:response regulator [Muriicola soli]|uniref:response regulator n=1 Tax=Muriicola soli TaxID=2507538 RepID=UPI0013EDE2AE|nr:response regulator [Muriicola soli]